MRDDRGGAIAPCDASRRRALRCACAFATLAALPVRVRAQAYPSRAVRVLVGQAPGGQSDTIARIVATELAARWQQNVVVENHGGAAGTIAGRMAARAGADGYTLFVGSNAAITGAGMDAETAGYEPLRDWAPIGRIARVGYVFPVRNDLGATTLDEFVALARARPGASTVATVGVGSNSSRGIVLFERAAGIRLLEVPYKGGAPGLQAVVAGQVDATFCDASLATPFAAAGSVRILASCGRSRLALLPAVPTFVEAGYRDVVVEPWYGIVAPAATPAAIVGELAAALRAVVTDAGVRQRFAALGYEAIVESAADFTAAMREELAQARALSPRP